MTHTPGPWKISSTQRNKRLGQDESFILTDRPYPNGACVAIVREGELFGELEGNANLIAAAPDLLTQLKEAAQMLNYLTPEQFDDADHEANWARMLEGIDKAIAKAEGREP